MVYPPFNASQPGLIQASFPGMENHSDVLRRAISSQLTPMTGVFKEPTQVICWSIFGFLMTFSIVWHFEIEKITTWSFLYRKTH